MNYNTTVFYVDVITYPTHNLVIGLASNFNFNPRMDK